MSDTSKITYIGITIGPVVRLLTAARATREFWAASYVLSWIMKQGMVQLKQDPARKFIIPYRDEDPKDTLGVYLQHEDRLNSGKSDFKGAGIFPDRIIFQTSKEDDLAATQHIFLGVLAELADDMVKVLAGNINQDEVLTYLKAYFTLHFLKKELDPQANPILALSPLLDGLEQRQYFPSQTQKYLVDYLSLATTVRKVARGHDPQLDPQATSVLTKDAFAGRRALDMKSIEHIAVAQFPDEEKEPFGGEPVDKNGKVIYRRDKHGKEIKSGYLVEKFATQAPFKDDFIQAHKYVAIVQADGDNVGKTIAKLEQDGVFSQEMAQVFSRILMEFSIYAAQQIHAFGGLPVYAGGDDLLFFAPVLNRRTKQEHIFELLDQLDREFQKHMETGMKAAGLVYSEDVPKPTLSFGLCMAYYKFPLYESLGAAQHLMFGVAKQKGKHAIAFQLKKHSGSTYSGLLSLGTDLSKAYGALLTTLFEKGNDMLLTSVAQKLNRERHLLDQIGADDGRVRAYLANSFNESIHQQPAQRQFIAAVAQLVPAVYERFPFPQNGQELPDNDPKLPHTHLFGLLRGLQFLVDDTTA